MTVRSPGMCDCCKGLKAQTPQEIHNRPGLSCIRYRSGTYSHFKASLIAGLSDALLLSDRQLQVMTGLKTRDDDDFTIALLDSWATVCDVLTFYQERIANECYLRTAAEQESIHLLARLIDYRPSPGIAASTPLAFFMETAEGAPRSAAIECKTQVQSIPGPGEVPIIFETVEKIQARGEHNELLPRLTQKHPLTFGRDTFYFQGVSTGLRQGDGLLVKPENEPSYFCLVANVAVLAREHKTMVTVQLPLLVKTDMNGSGEENANCGPMPQKNKAKPEEMKPEEMRPEGGRLFAAISANPGNKKTVTDTSLSQLNMTQAIDLLPVGVTAFRIRCNIFGHNAPDFDSLPKSLTVGTWGPIESPPDSDKFIHGFQEGPYFCSKGHWIGKDSTLGNYPSKEEDSRSNPIFLDSEYPIADGSMVVLKDNDKCMLLRATEPINSTKSNFTLTARITSININLFNDYFFTIAEDIVRDILNMFTVRGTTLFSGGELLALSDIPYSNSVSSDGIELDRYVGDLCKGQTVIVCGQATENGVPKGNICEKVTISSFEPQDQSGGFTRIFFKDGLKNRYSAQSVKIYGNVAAATAGESKSEVLGSGDSTQSFQRFHLLNFPLTYLSAQNSQGAASALEVYVDDVKWQETATLFDCGPADRVYTVRIQPDQKTEIMFGDGRNGARLPTGQDNVRAVYRKGLGSSGNVDSDKISLLLSMPLGLRSVRNPQAASGGSDSEDLESSRLNMPLGISAMNRLVSLNDYEDFSRAFAGIGKAMATWTWNGRVRGIFVTVAGPLGEAIEEDSLVYVNLQKELQRQGDPFVPVHLVSYRKVLFRIAAQVSIKSGYDAGLVMPEIKSTVLSGFSFRSRSFGQPVFLSEVLGLIKSVPGVDGVDVSLLYKVQGSGSGGRNLVLAASSPFPGEKAAKAVGAELLIIDPAQPFDSLEVMS